MIAFIAVVVVGWLVLLPPLFTGGACTAEFDAAARRIQSDGKSLASPALAAAYLRDRRLGHSVMSLEQCRRAKPRALERCSGGPVVIASVPVRNIVCSLYRDDKVRIYLLYDERDRLSRMQMEMSPYKSLPIPLLGTTLHWGR